MSAAQVTEEHIYTTAKVGKAYVAGEDAQAAQIIADSEARATAQANAQVESLISSAKNAIPASEHPAEPTVENWAWQIRNLGDDRRLVYAERDQLRAELQRLDHEKPWLTETRLTAIAQRMRAEKAEGECLNLRADLDAIKAIRNEEKARAASAEREVERLRECCDQTSTLCGKFITEDDGTDLIPNSARIANALARLKARADRAEANADIERTARKEMDRTATIWAERTEKAEAELATELGRLNWILRLCATGVFYRAESRAAIDAAMKGGTK